MREAVLPVGMVFVSLACSLLLSFSLSRFSTPFLSLCPPSLSRFSLSLYSLPLVSLSLCPPSLPPPSLPPSLPPRLLFLSSPPSLPLSRVCDLGDDDKRSVYCKLGFIFSLYLISVPIIGLMSFEVDPWVSDKYVGGEREEERGRRREGGGEREEEGG